MRRLIRWRIALPYLALLAAALIVFAVIAADRIRQQEADRTGADLLETAQFLAEALQLDWNADSLLQNQAADLKSYIDQGLTLSLITPDGVILETLTPDEQLPDITLPQDKIAQALRMGSAVQVTEQGISVLAAVQGQDGDILSLLQLFMPQERVQSPLGSVSNTHLRAHET